MQGLEDLWTTLDEVVDGFLIVYQTTGESQAELLIGQNLRVSSGHALSIFDCYCDQSNVERQGTSITRKAEDDTRSHFPTFQGRELGTCSATV